MLFFCGFFQDFFVVGFSFQKFNYDGSWGGFLWVYLVEVGSASWICGLMYFIKFQQIWDVFSHNSSYCSFSSPFGTPLLLNVASFNILPLVQRLCFLFICVFIVLYVFSVLFRLGKYSQSVLNSRVYPISIISILIIEPGDEAGYALPVPGVPWPLQCHTVGGVREDPGPL